MAIKATSDLIGEHVATGVDPLGRVHKLGSTKAPGEFNKIANTTRIFQFVGVAGGSNSVDLEGSIDGGQNWVTWASPITTDTAVIIDDGPLLMRSNVQTYNSGTIQVYAQKFLEE
ncbi:MAG TPA: hypothetical protein VMW10_09610 [Alphaproteobacteria bacterium]|nr:hypothetical protein [Alphaproteobacteria bacterium]